MGGKRWGKWGYGWKERGGEIGGRCESEKGEVE